ncbi:MAG: FTR1 family protein, partial [Candidatus Thorarchaeota archaeon]|nr:FTR1 family protein [Candidatus Thorarchaeota archaeon]
YLRRSNQRNLTRYVLGGAIAAIVSSMVIAILMSILWGTFEGPLLAVFEGTVVLIAALLLTTMIVWMWGAGSGVAAEIEDSVSQRTAQKSGIGVALLAFALVLREGVELVLFTMALAIQEGSETYLGVAIGLTLAIGVGLAIHQGSLKVSLKAFFNWTSVLLVLFAAGMMAYGIHELQEAGLFLIGPLEVWNINPPQLPDGSYPLLHEKGFIGAMFKALFGYNGNPSALEVIVYIGYLVVLSFYYLRNRRTGEVNAKIASDEEDDITVGTIST